MSAPVAAASCASSSGQPAATRLAHIVTEDDVGKEVRELVWVGRNRNITEADIGKKAGVDSIRRKYIRTDGRSSDAANPMSATPKTPPKSAAKRDRGNSGKAPPER